MKLLRIDSSILGDASASRTLTRETVSRWRAAEPHIEVKHLDLAAQELPHRSATSLARPSAAEAAALDEFLAADVIVIGAPMYNFSIPSQLKAWIDRIAVSGKRFATRPRARRASWQTSRWWSPLHVAASMVRMPRASSSSPI